MHVADEIMRLVDETADEVSWLGQRLNPLAAGMPHHPSTLAAKSLIQRLEDVSKLLAYDEIKSLTDELR